MATKQSGGPSTQNWLILEALVFLVILLGAAFVIVAGFRHPTYWTSVNRDVLITVLALIWLTGVAAFLALLGMMLRQSRSE